MYTRSVGRKLQNSDEEIKVNLNKSIDIPSLCIGKFSIISSSLCDLSQQFIL